MIKSFRCRKTERIFTGKFSATLPRAIQKAAARKLEIIDAARDLEDLKTPPGNRLEALSGDRRGQHSIRINEQWRVCFVWQDGNANDVEIVDYHQGGRMNGRDFPPVHPGEILLEEFLKPMGISQYRLAESIRVPARRINEIVLKKRGITADTSLRLSRFFGNSAQFWMNLQTRYELESARDLSAASIDREVRPYTAV
jgi:addiction module HigA family antidote